MGLGQDGAATDAVITRTSGERRRVARSRGVPIAAVVVGVGLDVAAKRWAADTLVPGLPVPLVGEFVRLRLGDNRGIAFGLLAQGGPAWLLPTALLVAVVAAWFVAALRTTPPSPVAWPLALILAGGSANVLDRWPDGRVTDFVDVGLGNARWPTFNLADAWISVGVALFVAATLRGERLGAR